MIKEIFYAGDGAKLNKKCFVADFFYDLNCCLVDAILNESIYEYGPFGAHDRDG